MKIGVIGIGKLGIAASLCFDEVGYEVYGLDLLKRYTESISKKDYKTKEPYINEMLKNVRNLKCGTSLGMCLKNQIVFIYIDTPLDDTCQVYNTQKISDILQKIKDYITTTHSPLKHIIIGSCIPPSYIKVAEAIIPKITISYKPELVEYGSIIDNIKNPPPWYYRYKK